MALFNFLALQRTNVYGSSPGEGPLWPFLKGYFIGSLERAKKLTLRRVFLDIFLWVFLKSQNGSFLSVCVVLFAGENPCNTLHETEWCYSVIRYLPFPDTTHKCLGALKPNRGRFFGCHPLFSKFDLTFPHCLCAFDRSLLKDIRHQKVSIIICHRKAFC